MKPFSFLSAFALLLFLAGCGPIYSAVAKSGEGIQDFQTVEGNLAILEPGSKLLVYGPFSATEEAYYIAKGEDASQFTARFRQAGFQHSELYLERRFKNLERTAQQLRTKTAAQLRADYDLDILPDTILFGTILRRGPVTVVPFRAVMPVTYRLEFYDVATQQSAVVEVEAKMRYEQVVPGVVEEILRRRGKAG